MLLFAPMNEQEDILATRLGKTVHASPLRFKLLDLRKRYPSSSTECIENWLVDVANARGARMVQRPVAPDRDFAPPPPDVFSNEEQVILRPPWKQYRVAIPCPWPHLSLYRLGDLDLLLSKLMRDDPIDHRDALFIARTCRLSPAAIEEAICSARIPANAEIQQQFACASKRLLARL
jgi:hypothetical protein